MDLYSIYAGLKLVTAPTVEPLSLVQAQSYLRVASDAGGPVDQDVTAFIVMARQRCESILRFALLQQTWQLSLKNWPGRDYQNWPQAATTDFGAYYRYDHIPLPLSAQLGTGGVRSLTYTDTSGTVFTMPPGNISGGYNVDSSFQPARIVLPFSQIWPTNILLPGAPIQAIYDCGYADVATLQAKFEGYAAVIQAMKIIIAHAFENKMPPSEGSKMDAGLEYIITQNLSAFKVY